ncbi:MAG TPA: tetratricopeptide repeat protein [Stellaceae bacterium]|nr:tetratricopeptide repeat protein [Stellaceae bacterium]
MGLGRLRQWGALLAVAVACFGLVACASKDKTDTKIDLTNSLLQAAATARAQNDWLSAANYYRSALTQKPDDRDASIGLLQALRMIGGLDEAGVVADKAVATRPDDAMVLAEAGKDKLAAGKLADAVDLLKRAAAVDSKDWRARSALGLAYARLGDFDGADGAFKAALAISPDNASVLNNYGMSRAMANDLEGARTILFHAVMLPNADVRVRQNLALVYALSGDLTKAEQLTRQDLPPALANATLDYYRQLAAATPAPARQ